MPGTFGRAAFAFVLAAGTLVACKERTATPPVEPAPIAAAPASASASASAAASAAAAVAAPATGTALVAYLRGAEIQAETDAQRDVLRRALRDLATLPAAELRAARYPASDGRPAQRDLVQVLRGHLVPTTPQGVDLDELLAGRDSEAGRAALQEALAKVGPPASK
jgi:hypothetical protein